MPPEATITACAPEREIADNLPRTGAPAGRCSGSRISPATPVTTPSCRRQGGDPVPECAARSSRCRRPFAPRRRNGSRTPARCPTSRGIEVPSCHGPGARDPVSAAFGPLDDREPAHTLACQPGALLTGGKARHMPRPTAWASSPPGRSNAAEPSQSARARSGSRARAGGAVRGVDEHQPAERPERLPAQRRGWLLVEDDHPAAGVSELSRRPRGRQRPTPRPRRPRPCRYDRVKNPTHRIGSA